MTVEELAERSHVKPETVRRNLNKIAGYTENRTILDGSRYPFNLRRYKLDNMEKRRSALLDATAHCQYIDNKMLQLSEGEFQLMIKELVQADLLAFNESVNKYGANMYSTTLKFDTLNKLEKRNRNLEITKIVGTLIGTATGSFYKAIS